MLVLSRDTIVGYLNNGKGKIRNVDVVYKIFPKTKMVIAKGENVMWFIRDRKIEEPTMNLESWELFKKLPENLYVYYIGSEVMISLFWRIHPFGKYTRISSFGESFKKYRGPQSLSPKWGPKDNKVFEILENIIEDHFEEHYMESKKFHGQWFYGEIIDKNTIRPEGSAPIRLDDVFEPAGKTYDKLYWEGYSFKKPIVSKIGEIGSVYHTDVGIGYYIKYKGEYYGNDTFWKMFG